MLRPPRRAFTLVELLVVLVLIVVAILLPAVLIGLIVVALLSTAGRSKRAQTRPRTADQPATPAPAEENVN